MSDNSDPSLYRVSVAGGDFFLLEGFDVGFDLLLVERDDATFFDEDLRDAFDFRVDDARFFAGALRFTTFFLTGDLRLGAFFFGATFFLTGADFLFVLRFTTGLHPQVAACCWYPATLNYFAFLYVV